MSGVFLRPLRLSDAESMLAWMNDPDSTRYLGGGFEKKRTLEDVRESIELRLDGEFTGETFAVADGETGEYLGQCDLLLPDEKAGRAEIAVVLLPQYRGCGYARQALMLLMKFAFENGYNRLFLKVCAENVPAIKLYESLDFVREGTLRRHVRVGDRLCDVAVYGMLKEDFETLHGSDILTDKR